MKSYSCSLQQLFADQKKAHEKEPYPSIKLRKDRIDRLINILLKDKHKICKAVESDFGRRSHRNTLLVDVLPPLNSLKHARKNVDDWVKRENRKSNFPHGLLGASTIFAPYRWGS